MKIFYVTLMILSIANSIESYKTDNFCIKTNKNSLCEDYTCQIKYCTTDRNSCKYLISLEGILKVYTKQNKMKKEMKTFFSGIKKCHSIHLKNQWRHRINFG